jgi:hypothetical protein
MSELINRPESSHTATNDAMELVRLGIDAAKADRYRDGLDYLAEAYALLSRRIDVKSTEAYAGSPTSATIRDVIPASALSYYGLCLAMHSRNFTEASTFCEIAIKNERFVGEHYLNLARVWHHGRNRKKMAEAIDRGMKASPSYLPLQQFGEKVGFRKEPVLGFLPRESLFNKALGMLRHKLKGESSAGSGGGRKKKRRITQSRLGKSPKA